MAIQPIKRSNVDLINDAASALSDAARVVVQEETGDRETDPETLQQAALAIAVQALGRTDVDLVQVPQGLSAPVRRVENNILGLARGLGLAMGQTASAGVEYQKALVASVMTAMSDAMIEASAQVLTDLRRSGN